MSKRIQRSLEMQGSTIVTEEEWNAELEAKHTKLVEWMKAQHLSGVLLRRHENLAWVTGGAVEARVLGPGETAVASILVTAKGRRYYLTTENEAPRLGDEEFAGLDFEPVTFPWYKDDTAASAARLADGPLGSDVPGPGLTPLNLYPLRASLLPSEIARYRWLGQETASSTVEALMLIEPGLSEFDMEAVTAANLLRRGIRPSVHLFAVDERIYKYKHAVPQGARMKNYAMLNLCARKWGLAISITRFVHFVRVPDELERRFRASAQVNAALLDATREGATAANLFETAKIAYAAAGFPGEEKLHHTGGATGYWEREWLATPKGTEAVVNHQAFAWNPSIQGGKVEDTVLLNDGKIECLTATPEMPSINVSVNGIVYSAADVLRK
ncbi:MAG: M24 family metallopeptidase [Terracidiphilus sp.]